METQITTNYICKYCHHSYSDKTSCLDCESKHKEDKYLDNLKEFELKPHHLALLKETNISWWNMEFGAPCIDPKRPYGNSDVEEDMAKIIGFKNPYNKEEDEYDEDELRILNRIHKEMKIVLQIVLHTQSFKLGKYYKKEDYSQEWFLKEKHEHKT